MRHILVLGMICLSAMATRAEGIEFFHGTWEETLKEAQTKGVLIFVDAYTTWCGPCKRMSSQIFPQESVGKFFNANFVSTKIDMESEAGMAFRRKYPVKSYPTFLFIDPDGEVVMQAVGARPAEDFIAVGEEALKKYDGSAKYQAMYDAGDHSYETVLNLIQGLNKSGKSSLRVANDYLKTQENLRTEENLVLILEAFTQVDSKMYEYIQNYEKDLVKLVGQDRVNARIREAAEKTAARAVEYESTSLLEEAIAAMDKHVPGQADVFEIEATMAYAAGTHDAQTYLKQAKLYLKKTSGDDAARLHEMSRTILKEFYKEKELLEVGEKAAKMSVTMKDNANYNITYATLIYLQGDKERAIKVIDDAITRLKEKDQNAEPLEELKKKISVS